MDTLQQDWILRIERMMHTKNITPPSVRPFVKWAGGKTQLLPEIRSRYPRDLGTDTNRYCEPFVGGGAVLFDLLANYPLKEVLINDINAAFITAYRQIQGNVHELISLLSALHDKFSQCGLDGRKALYYEKRAQFNALKTKSDGGDAPESAALFIFLNRTCFNGLFRVNRKGHFNVPLGHYKNPRICDANNLLAMHKILQNVQIRCGDYRECGNFIDSKTLVYIDPPYRPISATANFTAYAQHAFDDDSQRELAAFIGDMHAKGAKIILSNSDPKNTAANDNFFDNLYKGYNISRVSAKRRINRDTGKRGSVTEVLVSNF